MVRAGQSVLKSVAVLSGAAVVGSYLGALHPAGDSLAVFRVPLLILAALALIWTDWSRVVRWPLSALALAVLGWHISARMDPDAKGHDLVLYQQNLLFNRADNAEFLSLVAQSNPDVITLQEVSPQNLPIMEALKPSHPTQHRCTVANSWLGEAVLSRHPMVPGTAFCSQPDGLTGMQVMTPQGPLWVVSVHLNWPWPKGQAAQVDGILPTLEALDGPILMAGDFNAVAWSHTLKRMARASGTTRVGAQVHSFDLSPIPFHLGIDHVLSTNPAPQRVIQMPKAGSDHHGLLAYLVQP